MFALKCSIFQVFMLALTFLVLFLGNFLTTLKVVHQKLQKNKEKVKNNWRDATWKISYAARPVWSSQNWTWKRTKLFRLLESRPTSCLERVGGRCWRLPELVSAASVKLKISCHVALSSAMLFLLLLMQSQQLEGNVWVRHHWQPSDTVYSISETSIHFCFVPVHGYVYNKATFKLYATQQEGWRRLQIAASQRDLLWVFLKSWIVIKVLVLIKAF